MTSTSAPTIRPYVDDDEPRVIELLRGSLGEGPSGERSPAFFRWKHLENPFGRSLMLVAEEGGELLGLRAFMRWRLSTGRHELRAARAVDTATAPQARGRGVFSRLTSEALSQLARDTDVIFNTPNEQSLPGYLKLGWQIVGAVPVRIGVLRPISFLRGFRSAGDLHAATGRPKPDVTAPPAAEVIQGLGDMDRFTAPAPDRLHTRRTPDYLRWRYASVSGLDYRAVTSVQGGHVGGLAVFRVRPRGRLWEATVAEVLTDGSRAGTARDLLREVARASRADHVALSFPAGTAPARAARRRSLPAPKGMTLTVRPLHDGLAVDVGRLEAWGMTLGDLEVF